ncbi:MAG: hypothetical protein ACTSU5_16955 [Promethearchaeota archaeon]
MTDEEQRDGQGFTPLPKSPLASGLEGGDSAPSGVPLTPPAGSDASTSLRVQELEAQLAEKEREINELMQTFAEVKEHIAQYDEQISAKEERIKLLSEQLEILKSNQKMQGEGIASQLEAKEEQIKTLQSSLEMKGEQIDALKSSIELKNEQIQTLKENMLIKEEQVKTLKEDRDAKDKEIQEILQEVKNQGSPEEIEQMQALIAQKERLIEERNERIAKLEEEIKLLNQDLDATDSDIEAMQKEIDELRSKGTTGDSADLKAIRLNRDQILEIMRDIIDRGIHNISVVAPLITDLEDLNIFEVPSSVNIKVSCMIDQTDDTHNNLLMEYESLDNLSIRAYDAQDRWAVSKDNEELFLAAVGQEVDQHLAFHTTDEKHIRLFNPIIMEAWLRARKI